MAKAALTNDLAVRNLKAKRGAEITEYADKTNRGLLLRVSANGRKTWYYRYRDDGQRRFIQLGRYPSVSISEALALYEHHRTAGTDPWTEHQAEKQGEAARLTLEQLADKYTQEYAKPFKRSWKRDSDLLNRNVLGRVEGFPVPPISARKADEITRQDLLRVVAKVSGRGAWTEARKTARVLSGMFNWAVDTGILTDSPASRLTPRPPAPVRQKQAEKTDRTLTDDELRAIWNTLRDESESWAGVLAVQLMTGQRPGEVCSMEWRHVKQDRWVIPAEIAKNRREHVVPLPDAVQSFLSSLPHRGRYVFPASKVPGPIEPARINRKLTALLEREGIEHFGPHKLRAAVATRLEALGVPHKHIQAVLNHIRQDVTSQHYAKYDHFNEKLQALARWCAELDRIVNDRDEVVVSIRR